MVELIVLFVIVFALIAVINMVSGVLGIVFQVLLWMFVGFLAGKLLRGKGYGPFGDMALGIAGGIVGGLILGDAILGIGGVFGSVIIGVIGAVILVFGVRLVADADFAR